MRLSKMSDLLLSVFTYMFVGYLVGLVIGFTVFDPDTDVYALLSLVLALVGLILGIIPFFRKQVYIAFGILLGFYLGTVLSIVIWGDTATDDLLEAVQRGGLSVVLSLITAILGGYVGSRLSDKNLSLPALVLLLGGFLGGAIFITIGVAPESSMVGVAPFVIGSGVVLALMVWWLQKRRITNPPPQSS